MKTTEKYADKVKQVVIPSTSSPENTNADSSPPNSYPRDIVLMRIRHILKSAQNNSTS